MNQEKEQQRRAAFEAFATKNGSYDLRPAKWAVKSVGGVPYEGYVRPYLQDRTVYTYEGFCAALDLAPAAPAVTVSPAPRVESIDSAEFSRVLCDLIDAVQDMETSAPFDRARAKLVEFIDAHLARQAQPTDRDVEWISVDERLPDLYTTVALLDETRWMNTGSDDHSVNWHGAGYLCDFGSKCWSIFGEMRSQCLDAVTHWMPLPSAPAIRALKGKSGSEGAAS